MQKNETLSRAGLAQPENNSKHIFAAMIPFISAVIGKRSVIRPAKYKIDARSQIQLPGVSDA